MLRDTDQSDVPAPPAHIEETLRDGHALRSTIVDQHKYRDEIVQLLATGWSPTSLNQALGRLHPDYEPVAKSTLLWYRRERMAARMRPLESWSRKLQDEHVLLDSIRERAALIVLQEARLTRALKLEEQLGESIVLPVIGAEIDRLARLWDGYEAALARAGFRPATDGLPVPQAISRQTNVTILGMLTDQAGALPPEQKAVLADALERIRTLRTAERIKEVDAKIAASLPAAPTGAEIHRFPVDHVRSAQTPFAGATATPSGADTTADDGSQKGSTTRTTGAVGDSIG